MKMKFVLFAISMLIIAISGCIDNEPGSISTPVPTGTSITVKETTTVQETELPILIITATPTIAPTPVIPTVTITEQETITSTPIAQVYNIGKSVSNVDTKMTLDSIRYTKTINSKNPDPRKQFLIIYVTIENIGTGKKLSYSGDQFIVLDSDEDIERIYGEDASSLELAKHLNGVDISPGERRQGELSFQIPEGAKGLQLKFEYSPDSSGGSQSEFFTLDQ